MFKQLMACLIVAGLTAVVDFGGQTSGAVLVKKDQFTIDAWKLPIGLKHGNVTETTIAITRNNAFNDSVNFKLEDTKKGLTFDPKAPVIADGTKQARVKILASDDAELGDHTITVTGTPAKGGDTERATFTVTVKAK